MCAASYCWVKIKFFEGGPSIRGGLSFHQRGQNNAYGKAQIQQMSKLQKVWNRGVKRYSISSYKGRNMQVLWEKISSELGIGFHYEYFYSCYLGNYLLINKYIHYGNSILDNNYYIFVHILSNHSYLSDGRGKRQRIT